MKYKRGDFVHTSYNEIGVVLKVERPPATSWQKGNSYFIRLASGETTWLRARICTRSVDQVSETTNEI